jgi:hypothetical protein
LRGFFPTGEFEMRPLFPGASNNGLTIDPSAALTTDAMDALGQEVQQSTEKLFDFELATAQAINQALASSQSLEDLEQAAIQAGAQLVNQFAQQAIPGAGGLLLGGLLAFGVNQFLVGEEPIGTEDNPAVMLLANPRDIAIEIAAVRDREEISFNRQWQHSFAALATEGRV